MAEAPVRYGDARSAIDAALIRRRLSARERSFTPL
jgi:hypothetical protein